MSQSAVVDGAAMRDCAIQSNLRSVRYSTILSKRDGTGLRACFGTDAPDQHAREQAVARRIRVAPACAEHDPEKWVPVFGKDHAPT